MFIEKINDEITGMAWSLIVATYDSELRSRVHEKERNGRNLTTLFLDDIKVGQNPKNGGLDCEVVRIVADS